MDRAIAFALRHAKIHLVLLLAAFGALGFFALKTDVDFNLESLFSSGSDELVEYRAFSARHGRNDLMLFAAFKTADVFDAGTRAKIGKIQQELKAIEGVESVKSIVDVIRFAQLTGLSEAEARDVVTQSPVFVGTLVDQKGEVSVLVIELTEGSLNQKKRSPLLLRVRTALRDGENLLGTRFHLGGIPVIEHEYIRLTQRDLLTFMPISIMVFLFLLALYFRNIVGTLLPLVSVLVGVAWMLGAMYLAGRQISVLTTIVPNLMLVIGISDAVHLLSRYQEDLSRVPGKHDALGKTVRVMVWACFLTSFTTAVGFASLVVTNVPVVQEYGLIAAIGIMIVYVAVLQVTPAVLAVTPPIRGRFADEYAQFVSTRLLRGVARIVHHRRSVVAIVTLGVLVAAGLGISNIRENSSWLQDLDHENEVYKAHEFIESNLSSIFTVELSLDAGRAGGFREIETLRRLEAVEESIRKHPWVASVISVSDLINEGMRIRFGTRRAPASQEELDEIRPWVELALGRERVIREFVDPTFRYSRISIRASRRLESQGLEVLVNHIRALPEVRAQDLPFTIAVTGKSLLAKKSLDGVIDSMKWTVFVAAGVISLIMACVFGSLRTGLISMIPNFMPLVVTAGLMGYLEIDLNFSTITIFSISLGLAVDNTIHFLTRFRLEFRRDEDHTAAIYRTLDGVGRPMVFTTLLLVMGFAAILTSNFRFTFHFGLLGGVTVLTALLGDLFVLPVLLMVFKPKVRSWFGGVSGF